MDTNTLNVIVEAVGAGGTVASVLWAIKSFKDEHKKAELLNIKNAILELPSVCREVNEILSVPFFSALGNSIADELRKLKEDNQSLEEFSEFILNEEKSHNYKAQAVYSGLKKCDEVAVIKDKLKSIEELRRKIAIGYPGLGRAITKLLFYIEKSASRTISSRVLTMSISAVIDDEFDNSAFKECIEKAAATGSNELYFKELGLFLTSVAGTSLKLGNLGQRTLDLSLTMINNTCSSFGDMELGKLKKYKKKDRKIMKRVLVESSERKHAVEDAMDILKDCKQYYQEDLWDKMIECKGRIIENMESDED